MTAEHFQLALESVFYSTRTAARPRMFVVCLPMVGMSVSEGLADLAMVSKTSWYSLLDLSMKSLPALHLQYTKCALLMSQVLLWVLVLFLKLHSHFTLQQVLQTLCFLL